MYIYLFDNFLDYSSIYFLVGAHPVLMKMSVVNVKMSVVNVKDEKEEEEEEEHKGRANSSRPIGPYEAVCNTTLSNLQ